MSDSRQEWDELLPAYALNALEGEELERLEAALEADASLRARLAEYLESTTWLAGAFSPLAPPAALEPRIRRVVRALPVSLSARRVRARRSWLPWAAAAVLALAVGVLGGATAFQLHSVDQLQSQMQDLASDAAQTEQRLQEQREVTAWVAQSAVTPAAVRSVDSYAEPDPATDYPWGMLVTKPDGSRVLMMLNLPVLAAGEVYQVWLWDDAGEAARSVGHFWPDEDGYALAHLTMPALDTIHWLSVNRAKGGGTARPSGEPVLVGTVR
ncbi:MAG: anti-sigma factor [Chloroflexota bacterium]